MQKRDFGPMPFRTPAYCRNRAKDISDRLRLRCTCRVTNLVYCIARPCSPVRPGPSDRSRGHRILSRSLGERMLHCTVGRRHQLSSSRHRVRCRVQRLALRCSPANSDAKILICVRHGYNYVHDYGSYCVPFNMCYNNWKLLL